MSVSYFKMPDAVITEDATYSEQFGRFSLQPLERGFGVTLGNSLRRVLISSLPGSAIVAVKFSEVLHEFSTIPGVVEDVTEIILNLKQVRLKSVSKKNCKIDLSFNGQGSFTAADIQAKTSEVIVLNPDLHIATLNSNAKFDVELRIGRGKGYVPSIDNKSPDYTIGVIPIDAIYTPIVNVNFDVENVRIGDRNDYEKLTIQIQSDGSISPEDALTQSAAILNKHLQLFINLNLEQEESQLEKKEDTEKERIKKMLLMSVDELELSVRSHNCLRAANIRTISDLVGKEEAEMLKFRNFGRKSLAELMQLVEELGLEFGTDVDKYLLDDNDTN